MPLFSIILVHDQKTTPHAVYLRCVKSLEDQTFRDFEVLRYHDGPLMDDTVVFPEPIVCTPVRYGDWGHSLRDIGIREAKGEYIVHMDSTGILYPDALEVIAREIRRPHRFIDENDVPMDDNGMVIFAVKRWGMVMFREMTCQFVGDADFYLILDGNEGCYDSMQAVIRRELWLAEGGWNDKRENSYSYLYDKFTLKYGYRQAGPVLGESRRGLDVKDVR